MYAKEVVTAKPRSFMMKPFDVDLYLCWAYYDKKEQTLKN